MRRLSSFLLPLKSLVGLSFVLVACSHLPSGAPDSQEILKEIQADDPGFAFYQVTRDFVPTVANWPETGSYQKLGWMTASEGPKSQVIQPGDLLHVQVWDSNENSLMTVPGQRFTRLEGLKVSGNGSIFMPYVGNISLSGLSPELAREKIQDALEPVVSSAQVQLTMREGRNNSVDLVSGALRSGTYPIPDRNYTVMGLISAGGGITNRLNNPQIRLVRGGKIYGTSVSRLLDNPKLDTRLRGGDKVYVEEDERYFLSFGATGREALSIFTKDEMSAMDAISVSGGLRDTAADAKGILILREYNQDAVRQGNKGPDQTRAVFSLDLTTVDGLFAARKFQIHPQDLIIATEAPINDLVKVANIVGRIVGLAANIDRLAD